MRLNLPTVLPACVTLGLAVFAASGAVPPEYAAIARDEQARAVEPFLTHFLDAEPAIAARAALAAGRSKQPIPLNALRRHLVTKSPAVRSMVVYALGLAADGTSLGSLVRLERRDPASAVRYAAADAVGRIVAARPVLATEAVADVLLSSAGDDPDPFVRGHAAANLDAFGTAAFAGALASGLERRFARERDGTVRWHVMWILARAYPLRCHDAFLRRALADPNEFVRAEAARALGHRPGPRAAAVVRPLLDDPSWHVQYEAREALRRLAKEPPTAHLTALPPGIHLPPLPPGSAGPQPTGSTVVRKPRAPAYGDVPDAPPLVPTSAASLDGPLPGLHPRVRIQTTKGDVVVRLYPEWAPFTVANFLDLAADGYYNGNRFFRIVPDFVVQTGDQMTTAATATPASTFAPKKTQSSSAPASSPWRSTTARTNTRSAIPRAPSSISRSHRSCILTATLRPSARSRAASTCSPTSSKEIV